jgi:RNA polymerase sigma-70 factor (ECF subfamily)
MTDAASPPTLSTLYREHHGWLRSWLHRKLACRHDAADLAQDTFLRLLAQAEQPVLREPRAYLLVIANRLLINQYQRRRVETETLRAMTALLGDEQAPDAERIVAARQLLAEVMRLLVEELDENPRRAFLMARVDGASYTEIARKLKVSESSVKQYLAKALAHCHARLHDGY